MPRITLVIMITCIIRTNYSILLPFSGECHSIFSTWSGDYRLWEWQLYTTYRVSRRVHHFNQSCSFHWQTHWKCLHQCYIWRQSGKLHGGINYNKQSVFLKEWERITLLTHLHSYVYTTVDHHCWGILSIQRRKVGGWGKLRASALLLCQNGGV